MRRIGFLAGILVLLALSVASAQPATQFRLRNGGEQAIMEVYVTPSGSAAWAADALGDQILPSGRQLGLRAAGCLVDIRVVFQDGRSEERRGVNVCQEAELVFGAGRTAAVKIS
jgi:hypothetical protein